MKTRESNYELMRIISMFLIIIYHTIGYGNLIYNTDNIYMKGLLYLIRYTAIVHVNSFVLLSGYFQSKSKFKLSKLLNLVLCTLFYVNVLNLVLYKIGYLHDVTKFSLLTNILPSLIGNYWFISTYVLLYILSDYLNLVINRLNKDEYKKLLVVLFIVVSIIPFVFGHSVFNNSGFSLYNFVFLYFIGGYLRRYPLKDSYYFNRYSKTGYLFFLIFIFFMMVFISFSLYALTNEQSSIEAVDWIIDRINDVRRGHSTPYVIIQSICYFEIFGLLSFKSKIVNYLSSCTFGIYLFHEHKYIRPIIYVLLGVDRGGYSFSFWVFKDILVCAIIIFLLGVIIDSLRKIIFKIIGKTKLLKKIKCLLKNMCSNLSYKVEW
ncbi:MAG: acyltransferase [Bacilli bacterium]|nr:acyltransferase [Bacilli bacterium]